MSRRLFEECSKTIENSLVRGLKSTANLGNKLSIGFLGYGCGILTSSIIAVSDKVTQYKDRNKTVRERFFSYLNR